MKIGILFPGYSNQYVGMGKEIYDNSRVMQELFEEASSCLPINFVKLCFASSEAELAKIENAYTALFLTSFALASVLKEYGLSVSAVAGFDIGELTAIAYAGGISFPDGLYVLSKYAQLYQEALATWQVEALHVKGLALSEVKKMCSAISNEQQMVTLSVYDAEDEGVVAGHSAKVNQLKEELMAMCPDISIKPYAVEKGMHNSVMDSIIMYLTKYLEKVDFKETKIPVIMSVDGQLLTSKDDIARRFIYQLQAPIHWDKVLKQLEQCDIIVQVGPGTELIKRVQELYPDKQCVAINNPVDLELVKELINKNVDKTETPAESISVVVSNTIPEQEL